MPRRPKLPKLIRKAASPGWHWTADERFLVHRPFNHESCELEKWWKLQGVDYEEHDLLVTHRLVNAQFATRREALEALALALHIERRERRERRSAGAPLS